MFNNGYNNDIASYMYTNKYPFRNYTVGVYPENICPTGSQPYSINPGDTLFSISKQFGTTVQQIMYYNPGINPYHLRIGQNICIPMAKKPDCQGELYTIKHGDTLYTIAQSAGTTVEAILKLNTKIDPYNLIPGQTICIPLVTHIKVPPKTCPENHLIHVVKANETLSDILVKYDCSYTSLLFNNPDADFYNLSEGTELCVPNVDEFGASYCPTGKTYLTKKGDNLASIAEIFAVTTNDLLIINRSLRPSDFESPCVRICIPEAKNT